MIITKDVIFNERGGMDSQVRRLDANLTKVFQVLQHRTSFTDNIAGQFLSKSDTGTANTEFSITHTLGVAPIDFIVTSSDKATSIYLSGTTWTATTIYLKSSTANCNIRIFLIKP